jgi:hypothetical protein
MGGVGLVILVEGVHAFIGGDEVEVSGGEWKRAYDDFFKGRIGERYLTPIRLLQNERGRGEGFSIVSIQCALIEFLAANERGFRYEHGKPDDYANFRYSGSGKLFRESIVGVPPFSGLFNEGLAVEFYTHVRCSLLHEAGTTGGWKIRTRQHQTIDMATRTLCRDGLQMVIDTYCQEYAARLQKDAGLQQAFIRKFQWMADDAT